MLCKFCNAEIEDGRKYCPECGKRQDIKEVSNNEKTRKTGDKGIWMLIVGIVAGLLLAGALVVIVAMGRNDKNPNQNTPGTTAPATTTPVIKAPESEYTQYAGIEVGKLTDVTLTNDVLQIMYMSMIGSFLDEYGEVISYLGLDMSKPLSEQAYPYKDENNPELQTWEDFFLELAIVRWENAVAILALAEQEGFVLSEEWKKNIDDQIADLENIAKEGNYENADAMIKTVYGDCCSVEAYKTYLTLDTASNVYYSTLLEVTDAQVEESFLKNEETLKKDGITKESGFVSSVRHILIAVKGGTTDESGKTTYSDAEWETCKQEAEKVLQEWLDGDATEASFSALVKKYTADTASASAGGLYENITRDSNFVETFRDWAVDASRKKGDTGLVKSPYGYHIMYYVSGEAEWIYYSRGLVQNANVAAMEEKVDKYLEENPAEISRDLIKLQNIYAK